MEPTHRAGRRPGDRYVRVRREDLGVFRRTARGHLVATEAASQTPGAAAQWSRRVRDTLLGRPLDSEAIETERLSVARALPILSSDALSSVAYGPEAALAVLAVAGVGALFWNIPIAIAVALLMLIVTISYRQVIRGHPGGGGSYAVARANLGLNAGLVAAAALLVDYVLTVSVSVSSGVDALLSPFQELTPYRALISVALVAIIMLGNLRGVREAGALFAVPTYLFVAAIGLLIVVGLAKAAFGGAPHAGQYPPLPVTEPLTPLLVLAAFASGCSSMTGIEAVSNGVPSFADPRVRNAIVTLTILGGLLVVLFIGVEVLDVLYAAVPRPGGSPTVLAQIAEAVFTGPARWLYFGVQFSTTLVLVLAANTSFNGFPRLCAILARDDFLPHMFSQLGNRLVYSFAIVFLAVTATVLMLAFAGNTNALINLFALGVFTAFSLAQTAMVRHWWTRREPGWRQGLVINAIGAAVTALVDVIIIITKGPRGAWVVIVLIPLLVLAFRAINGYYVRIRSQVERVDLATDVPVLGPAVVPVLRWDDATADAFAYASHLRDTVIALNAIGSPPPEGFALSAAVSLRMCARPGMDALIAELDAIRHGDGPVTVVVPDEPRPLWMQALMRPELVRLKAELLWRSNVVAASCPAFRAEHGATAADAPRVAYVPVSRFDAVSVSALNYARALGADVVAIHVVTDVERVARDELDEVADQFDRWTDSLEGAHPKLVVIESPYREVVPPVLAYVMRMQAVHPGRICTMVIPELVDRRIWTLWLHNHRAFRIKAALLRQAGIGVADVTFHVRELA